MPAEKTKVEGFKLTKEQMSFTKKMKDFQKVFALIQNQFVLKAGETQRLGQLLDGMEEKMKTALRMPPKEPTIELEGQEPPMEDQETPEGPGAPGALANNEGERLDPGSLGLNF